MPKPPDAGPGEQPAFSWRSLVTGLALGHAFGPAIRLLALTYLALGSFVLVMAWQTGPQRLVEADRARAFTAHRDAHVVESWLAVDWDPAAMGSSKYWPGFARARPCAVVEYDGDWGSARRAFCGTNSHFHEKYALHDLREMSPGVAFDFARDANGFSVPQIRVGRAARDWLATHAAVWGSYEGQVKKRLATYTALDELRVRLDRPVDLAVTSWSKPPPAFPLAYDPGHPTEAMPAGFIAARRDARPDWFPAIFASGFGLAFWFAGMNILLSNFVPIVRLGLGAFSLLALPWWAEELPKVLRSFDSEIAATMAETFEDIETTSRITAGEPTDAMQYQGERLLFGVEQGLYADTIGRLRFVPPAAPPASANAALAALVASTSAQVRGWKPADRTELFERLKRDKEATLMHAGLVFLPAAKEALADPRSDAELQRAAYRFLSEWVVTPTIEPRPKDVAFDERLRLTRELLDIPVTVIAYPASFIVERAVESAKK